VSPVDGLLALVLLPFALNGWRRGLCREGFDLVGVVGGLIIAAAAAPAVTRSLSEGGVPPLAAFPIALAVVLVAAMVVARVLGAVFAHALRAVFLGGVDRAAGLCFGALKGAACLGLILMLLDRLAPTPAVQIAIQGSLLGPTLMNVATSAMEMGREFGWVSEV
jgi:membrane protein required for colicin V production